MKLEGIMLNEIDRETHTYSCIYMWNLKTNKHKAESHQYESKRASRGKE